MITFFSGRPGSGKSYRVVYELRRLAEKYFIFHNIKGLKLQGNIREIDQFCKDKELSYAEFFSLQKQKEISKFIEEEYGLRVLVILDECYRFVGTVPPPDLDRRVIMEWFAQHRHLGQDIFLICQSIDQLYRPVRGLLFERIHAKRGKLLNLFLYDHYEGTKKIGTSNLSTDKTVFDLYKSYEINSLKVKRSKKLLYFVLIVVFSSSIFLFSLYRFFHKPSSSSSPISPPQAISKPEQKKEPNTVQPQKSISNSETTILPEFSKPDSYRLVAFSKTFVFFADESGRIEKVSDGVLSIENGVVFFPYHEKVLKVPYRFQLKSIEDIFLNLDDLPAKSVFKLFCEITGVNYSLDTLADFKINMKVAVSFGRVSDLFFEVFSDRGFIITNCRGVYKLLGGANSDPADLKTASFGKTDENFDEERNSDS